MRIHFPAEAQSAIGWFGWFGWPRGPPAFGAGDRVDPESGECIDLGYLRSLFSRTQTVTKNKNN